MEVEWLFVLLGVFVAVLGVTSLIYLLFLFRNDKLFDKTKSRDKTTHPAAIMVVVGAGGHCAEMIKLMQALGNHYQPRQYVIAKTDMMSVDKVKELESTNDCKYQIYKIPRSREVGQSYITSVLSTAYSVMYSFPLVFKLRPEVILCNGPGTCIPICIAGFVLKEHVWNVLDDEYNI